MNLKEDYPDEQNPENVCYQYYKEWNLEHEFEKLRPKKLNNYQTKLLNLFYKCRMYADDSKSIPLPVLKEISNCDFCEQDIAEYIITGVDGKFLEMCSEKIKRDLENLKNKGRQ
jgi:hypothetical protein